MADTDGNPEGLRHRPSQANSPQSDATGNDFNPPLFHNYASANEYSQAVRTWLWAYHSWQFSSCFAPLLIHQQPQQLAHATATQPVPTQNFAQVQPATANRPAGGGRNCFLPTFGRRLVAESIDFVFCFVIKLLVSYALVEVGLINIDKYEKLLTGTSDLKTFIDVTQELFPLEVIHKVLTSLLEAFYISNGIGSVPAGSTPGKFMMGLRVVTANEVVTVANEPWRASVWPATPVSFLSSLTRAMIKNFALGFLFPVCVGMYMFRHGRSFYDLVAGTIVVEIEQNQ